MTVKNDAYDLNGLLDCKNKDKSGGGGGNRTPVLLGFESRLYMLSL